MEITTVEIPKKKVEIYRAMQPGESIQVEERKRQSIYHQAQIAVPTATWRTVKIDGKVYLNRVS
jgi:hypothetical protein